MARQSSFLKLEGTIGDVTFYKDRTGQYNARTKGGVSKSRIMTDKQFQRTRENLAEFARAAKASKLLKDAFRKITLRAKDLRTNNRLYAKAIKVLKTDTVNVRGERTVADGNMAEFMDFQFSYNSMLESAIYARYAVVSQADQVVLTMEPFVPSKYIAAPIGATHFRVFITSAAVDFSLNTFQSAVSYSDSLELSVEPVEELVLSIPKATAPEADHFYALGIEFFQIGNQDLLYDLNNKAHNAAKIILIEPRS